MTDDEVDVLCSKVDGLLLLVKKLRIISNKQYWHSNWIDYQEYVRRIKNGL